MVLSDPDDEELRAEPRGGVEGERLQAFATARKLLRMGLEVRNIAIVTGLSATEIESTKKKRRPSSWE